VDTAATAPALEERAPYHPAMDEQKPPSGDGPRPPSGPPPRQVPLFDDRPKIIPFESITHRKKTLSPRRRGTTRSAPPEGIPPVSQAPLDLRSPAPLQRKAVNDDALVASPAVRLRAALIDAACLAAGIGTAALTFRLLGGSFDLLWRRPLPWAAAVLAIAMFYHLFWSILGRESAGMRCLRLRLLSFDGHRPDWKWYTLRFVVMCCGTVAVGLGPLWALIDNEGLTWHDHISKTFPTEFDPTPSTLRRR
jgi:uncharacterized RDD family membrane protein YckC